MFSFLISNGAWFCFVSERIVQAYSATELEGTPTEVNTQSVLWLLTIFIEVTSKMKFFLRVLFVNGIASSACFQMGTPNISDE